MAPERLKNKALEIISKTIVFYLATVEDKYPRVRPMTLLCHEGFTLYTCTPFASNKIRHVEANPWVESCFVDESGQIVRIQAKAVLLQDDQAWTDLPINLERLPQQEDPDFMLMRLDPYEAKLVNNWSLDYQLLPL